MRAGIGSIAGIVAGASALRFAPARAQSAAETVSTQRLGGDLHLLTVGPTNVVARTDPDGVLLVDGPSGMLAEGLTERIGGLPGGGGPIHTLFNTHWHPEQTGLNERAGRAGAAIVAHENTRLWLETDITYPWDGQHFEPLPEIARPNQTFYEDGVLDSGVRYGYLRHAAHTDGDLYVYFPEQDVLAVGDTLTGAGWPFVDWWTGGWIGGIVGNLELLLHISDAGTRIVPARGPVLGRAELEAQYAMYDTIYERLSRLLNSGRGPDEAVAARPTAEFDAKMGPPDAFVWQAFTSLWAYLSPDASRRRGEWPVIA